jgi:hypothetical protein
MVDLDGYDELERLLIAAAFQRNEVELPSTDERFIHGLLFMRRQRELLMSSEGLPAKADA